MLRHIFILHAVVCAALASVSIRAVAASPPTSVLIATNAVSGEGIESADLREKFEKIYNTFMQQVIDTLADELQHNQVRVGTYIHHDVNTSAIGAIRKKVIDDKYEGLIQLRYQFLSGSGGNRTVINCDYLKLQLPPSGWRGGGTAAFGDHVAKSYPITSTAGATLRSDEVATDCFRTISETLFAPGQQWRLPVNE